MAVTATQGNAIINGFLSINSVDVSDQTYSWAQRKSIGSSPITTPGDNATYHTPGNHSDMLDVVFWDDQHSGGITGVLFAILGTMVAFEARHDAGTVGADNPRLHGMLWIVGDFIPIQAPEDGQPPQISCSFPIQGKPTRAIT